MGASSVKTQVVEFENTENGLSFQQLFDDAKEEKLLFQVGMLTRAVSDMPVVSFAGRNLDEYDSFNVFQLCVDRAMLVTGEVDDINILKGSVCCIAVACLFTRRKCPSECEGR
jgi:hypothetical protein